MTLDIPLGTASELSWTVERKWCTQRGSFQIFSTPSMVQLAELAAIQMLAPFLGADRISVGVRIDIQHLAPTLEGMQVHARSTLTAVDGARLTFEFEIFDSQAQVGAGTHERFVLDMARYMRRLEKKKAEVEPGVKP